MTPAEQLREKVASLQTALLKANPRMPVLLREIHTQLKSDEELVTILSDEEVGIIVTGLQRQTNAVILATVAKKGTGKALKKTTVDDI
jgi:hypothetical protein